MPEKQPRQPIDVQSGMRFPSDEHAIRNLVTAWLKATSTGDLQAMLTLMSEDVVFLTAGQPPLRGKEAFTKAFRSALQHVRIEAASEIQEIRVAGEMAYCWNYFSVATIPLNGESPRYRKGHTLTILCKTLTGAWVVTRDANMLASDSRGC